MFMKVYYSDSNPVAAITSIQPNYSDLGAIIVRILEP